MNKFSIIINSVLKGSDGLSIDSQELDELPLPRLQGGRNVRSVHGFTRMKFPRWKYAFLGEAPLACT